MKVKALLATIRILDKDGCVSLSALFLYVSLVLCAFQPITPFLLGLLALVFAHVNLERLHNNNSKQKITVAMELERSREHRIKTLEEEVQKLVHATNISRIGR